MEYHITVKHITLLEIHKYPQLSNNRPNPWVRLALGHEEKTPIAKCIDLAQPARTAQADLGRYILQMH